MRKTSDKVPHGMKAVFDAMVKQIDEICEKYLNEEYASLAREVAAVLARKRPSPLLGGKIEAWSCGILYALGYVNFLFDSSCEPYLSADQLCRLFGVSKATGYNKSKTVRDLLRMVQLDPRWCLESLLDENPLAWMIEVNGIAVDARMMSLEIQQIAFERGLIPYIPSKKKQTASTSTKTDTTFLSIQQANEPRRQKGKEEKRGENSSQHLLDF